MTVTNQPIESGPYFVVYGDKAAPTPAQEVASAKEWDAEIAKLKAETPPKPK
jgi:hypothetical protein